MKKFPLNQIKHFLGKVPNPILLWIMVIIFMAVWPIILIWNAIHSLFSKKISDSKKVLILKEIVTIFTVLGVLILIYLISNKIFGVNYIDY